MSIEDNKALVKQYIEKAVIGDISALEFVASNCVFHALGVTPHLDFSRESLEQALDSLPLSDVSLTIGDVVAEGDKVVLYDTVKGTNTGKFQNNKPTGKIATFESLTIFRIEDGKIAEGWVMRNVLSIYQQLGITPPSTPPSS